MTRMNTGDSAYLRVPPNRPDGLAFPPFFLEPARKIQHESYAYAIVADVIVDQERFEDFIRKQAPARRQSYDVVLLL